MDINLSRVDSDKFLEMPKSTQLLYFHLAARANFLGFVNNPKAIMKSVDCVQGDYDLLIKNNYIMATPSGIRINGFV